MDKMLEELSTGIPSLDQTLQGILAGDNIVLQTDRLEDFIPFVHRYCRYIAESGKRIVYFRFADHASFLPEGLEAEIHELDLSQGLERVCLRIFTVIEEHGLGGYYLFDCLSWLATAWNSDRMLANFFMLTCPYLYDFETVTYFVLLRNLHTPLALNGIRDTAQVILDVFYREDRFYLLPLKVFNRSSRTLYMLHCWEDERFRPVTASSEISAILSGIPQPWLDVNVDRRDPWTRLFIKARAVAEGGDAAAADGDVAVDGLEGKALAAAGRAELQAEAGELKARLIKLLLVQDGQQDGQMFDLCCRYFDLESLLAIGKRLIGSGQIGGKAAGMLLARRILELDEPELAAGLETHDSFYIGSDVFHSYIITNRIWHERVALRRAEDLEERANAVAGRIRCGVFAPEIVDQFREILDYFGQSPLIVRSSSLLEDAYGNAFSGKYESVFCANQGNPEQRMAAFQEAVRVVYASAASPEALSYRAGRGLLEHEEQMAILVQRVSGEFYGDLYFPHLGGVGYSFNPFAWHQRIDPESGMLRMVLGLGTRAVDRHDDDYTRILALNEPLLRPEGDSDEIRSHSQRIVNVLDLAANDHVSMGFEKVFKAAPQMPWELFCSQDLQMAERAREAGMAEPFTRFLSFARLLESTDFCQRMRRMMAALQRAYRHPVDIEFTANYAADGGYAVNLLQCRPFQVRRAGFGADADVGLEAQPMTARGAAGGAGEGAGPLAARGAAGGAGEGVRRVKGGAVERLVLETAGPVIGHSALMRLRYILYVRPEAYAGLSGPERYSLARLIGRVSNHPDIEGPLMLLGPGRWGSRMPELGVPISFLEIRKTAVLAELSTMHEGLHTDLSLGTHFFNDLVDMNIIYLGIREKDEEVFFDRQFLESLPDQLERHFEKTGHTPGRDLQKPAAALHLINCHDAGPRGLLLKTDTRKRQARIYT